MKKILLLSLAAMLAMLAAKAQVQPGYFGANMSDFTLPSLQGKEVKISDLKGKNVMLIFSRGRAVKNVWCGICIYQYAELADMELHQKLQEKYNLEILFVLPFDKDTTQQWVKGFPERMKRLEQWKNPADTTTIPQEVKDWMHFCRKHYPQKFEFTEDNVPTPLTVLYDADLTVSKGLDLYREEWDGTKVGQNIPTIFILDKNGTIRFKYHSQATQDRPNADYLVKVLDMITK